MSGDLKETFLPLPNTTINRPSSRSSSITDDDETPRRQSANLRRKLVIIGDGGCGKTSLLMAYSRKLPPTQSYIPTVFENYVVQVQVDHNLVDLQLWDTAGTSRSF